MVACTLDLLKMEKEWLGYGFPGRLRRPGHRCIAKGRSLYIRPTSICMDNRLGISSVTKMKTFVVLSPVGPYYSKGFNPIKLYCDTKVVRAWPGGFGDKKVGGNYAPTLKTARFGRD